MTQLISQNDDFILFFFNKRVIGCSESFDNSINSVEKKNNKRKSKSAC